MAVWNANKLAQHDQEIKIFLTDNDIDVMLISEAHVTDKIYKESYMKILKYSVYCTKYPEGKAQGGAAVIF